MVARRDGCRGKSETGEGNKEGQPSGHRINESRGERNGMGNTVNDSRASFYGDRW